MSFNQNTLQYYSEQGSLLERAIFIKSKNPPPLIVFNNTLQIPWNKQITFN